MLWQISGPALNSMQSVFGTMFDVSWKASRDIVMSLCLCQSGCLSVSPAISLPVCRHVCLSVCLSFIGRFLLRVLFLAHKPVGASTGHKWPPERGKPADQGTHGI